MEISKIYDEKLALLAVKKWHMDKDIQKKFCGDISAFYHHLAAQDIKQKAQEKWNISPEIKKSYKTFSNYLSHQFAERAY